MPIVIDKNIIPRIRLSENTEIRRIFKGDELVFGLFNALYKIPANSGNIVNGGSSSVKDDENNPDTFTWGIGIPSLKNPAVPSGVTFVKWCSDKSVKTAAPLIDKNEKQDTIRYALVYISGTQYKGTYEWWE